MRPDTELRAADVMLRYALYGPHVDRLIVSIRKREWIAANVESMQRGPLTAEEREWLRLEPPPT